MLFPTVSTTRAIQDLNGIWDLAFDPRRIGEKENFHKEPPAELMEVAVPGSINEQIVDRQMNHSMEWFWYYHSFRVSPLWQGRRIILRFGSVTFRAQVYLNGEPVGGHTGGFMPFSFDITDRVCFDGENHLCVRVDNDLSPTTVPQGHVPSKVGGVAGWRPGIVPDVHYDHFPFTGIHRPVQLLALPETRLERIRLTTMRLEQDTAQLQIDLRSVGGARQARIRIAELGFETQIPLSDGAGQTTASLTGVTPWAPLAAKLYEVQIDLHDSSGALCDVYTESFGFRTVKIREGELLVNDEPVYLAGFGRHEDNNIVGKGQSLPHLVKDYNLMKWLGANSYRTSHYPYSEEDLRMADRQGFLVIDEAAANTISFSVFKDDPEALQAHYKNHVDHLEELFTRDYNHPSVIGWSLGNECETWLESSVPYFTDLMAHARTLDASRPITSVVNAGPGECLCSHLFDIICVNRYPAWYWNFGQVDEIEKTLLEEFDAYWEEFKKPIIMTEFGADAITGLHNEYNVMWSEEYQASYLRECLNAAAKHPRVCGAHIWNFADFKVGQHTQRIVHNWKGIFTRERHPKLAAHIVRELWTGKKPADAHEFGNIAPGPKPSSGIQCTV